MFLNFFCYNNLRSTSINLVLIRILHTIIQYYRVPNIVIQGESEALLDKNGMPKNTAWEEKRNIGAGLSSIVKSFMSYDVFEDWNKLLWLINLIKMQHITCMSNTEQCSPINWTTGKK